MMNEGTTTKEATMINPHSVQIGEFGGIIDAAGGDTGWCAIPKFIDRANAALEVQRWVLGVSSDPLVLTDIHAGRSWTFAKPSDWFSFMWRSDCTVMDWCAWERVVVLRNKWWENREYVKPVAQVAS